MKKFLKAFIWKLLKKISSEFMQEKNCSIFVGNFLNNGFRYITNFLINLNH